MSEQQASSHFDLFTKQARHVFSIAQKESIHFRHNYVGTEHLLLGLVQEEEGGAARILTDVGVDTDGVRNAIANTIGFGEARLLDEVGLTSNAKNAIGRAGNAMQHFKHRFLGTEHLLLALISVEQCIAVQVLNNLKIDLEKIQEQLFIIFAQSSMPANGSLPKEAGIVIPFGFTKDIRRVQELERIVSQDIRAAGNLLSLYEHILKKTSSKKEPLFYASIYKRMGVLYRSLPYGEQQANLFMAMNCLQEALRFYTPKTAPWHYADTQKSLGNVYGDVVVGDRLEYMQRAITCYEEALRFWTRETQPLGYAIIQHNLGTTYGDIPTKDRHAHFEKAIACFKEALYFRRPETQPLMYAETQLSLGTIYCQRSAGDRTTNFKLAIQCYKEALRFFTAETVPFMYARVQHNLGNAYSNLPTGDRTTNLTLAIQCYTEALRFLTPEVDPRAYAQVQLVLGNAYRVRLTHPEQDLARAIECYQKALRFLTPDVHPLHYAGLQYSLGLAYGAQFTEDGTNLTKAIEYFHEALQFQTRETDPLAYAATLNMLGFTYQYLIARDPENRSRAITHLKNALHCFTLENDIVACRKVSYNLANLYFERGEWEEALSTYRIAIQAGERLYRAGLSNESKMSEITENAILYSNAAFAAVRCGKTTEALLLLEQGKTRLLTEALRLGTRRPPHIPDELWQRFEQGRKRIQALQEEKIFLQSEMRNPVLAYEDYVQTTQAVHNDFNAVIEQIRIYEPQFLTMLDLPTIEHSFLESDTALLTFCITTQGVLGFVVSWHPQLDIQIVEFPGVTHSDLSLLFAKHATEESISKEWLVAYYQHRQADQKNPVAWQAAFDNWQQTITHVLTILGKQVMGPIVSCLPDTITRLIVQPTAELFLIPFHAIPLSDDASQFVCDRYEVSYTPSMEVWLNVKARVASKSLPSLYAAIHPNVDPPLHFAESEGEAIARLFKEKVIHKASTATKNNVALGVLEKTYIHFSCHGNYNWNDPLLSGLLLTDGTLTLAELQEGLIDLSEARLVTLSACETGISDVLTGHSEEYVGVPAGFLVAGVPCVVSSLWSVDDLSTTLLMERFYRNHLQGGMTFAAALQEAQRWLRQATAREMQLEERWHQIYSTSSQAEERQVAYRQMRYYRSNPELRPFAHPYYWAAFTVNGM